MRKLFIILLSVSTCLTAFSQEKGSFEFGFNVGYNLSTVTSGSTTNSTFRSAFNAGGFGDYYFSNRWSIKAKLTYDQKGWNDGFITNLNNGQSFKTDYRIDYLTIPVMANWHFGKKRNWYLNFGPYAGFLLNAKETMFNTDLKEIMNSTDFGLAAGIGVKIPVAKKLKILLELDGQSGFTDVLKNNQGSTINNSRSSFNTGLVFDL
ncbi:porin family protein [Pedobacter africanus]|uniref:Outer membrane protein beta-barrel domain-containing protein n=1 Tax=Pedobacter africanus TaxID=151894 RepID=A0A1W1ZPE1_9SPHI|nr:porin family protein [Pedobacter africanus]SMC49978.1 Outer membrane protein beta-barrel domain-containing protein [Pedobacter africanus]